MGCSTKYELCSYLHIRTSYTLRPCSSLRFTQKDVRPLQEQVLGYPAANYPLSVYRDEFIVPCGHSDCDIRSWMRKTSLRGNLPQGSVISPLLFAIMVNDLSHAIKSDHGMFADDCAFWESGASIPGLITSTQSTLNNICKWCLKWGFTISKTKSVATLFTKKAKDMSTFPRNKWITPYIRPKIQIPWYHIRPKLVLQEPRWLHHI